MWSWFIAMEVFLISVGALSLAIGVSYAVPTTVNMWPVIHSCLKPPYLHLLINAIIITIAASSRFRQTMPATAKTPPPPAYSAQPEEPQAVYDGEDEVIELKAVMVNGLEVDVEEEGDVGRKLTHKSLLPPERPAGNIPEKAMEERYETLESIWKKIMEGKSHSSHEEVGNIGLSSYGIQKEASPSQDELSQRVETFIKKVHDQMKLQRQKSLKQSMEI